MKPGPEMDAKVCELIGIEPRILWILSVDGGEGNYFHSDYKSECESHLADIRKRWPNSWRAKGEVVSVKLYPKVSQDPGEMMRCWDWLNEQGYMVRVQTMPPNVPWLVNDVMAGEPDMPVRRKTVVILHRFDGQSEIFRDGVWRTPFFGDTPAHALAEAVLQVAASQKEDKPND